MNRVNRVIGAEIENLQRESFGYFEHEINSLNGLVIDKTAPDSPASIAATGFALAAYPVGVERGFISRTAAVQRTLTTLRFFWSSAQSPQHDATGYQGLYYHFWTCKPDAVLCSASYRRSTARSCSRNVDGGSVFRRGHRRRARNSDPRRHALSARQLGVGTE